MRSLVPRELGAWVQVVMPVGTALVCGRPNLAAIFFTVFAGAYLMLHPPALLALGYLGEEVRREQGWRARRRLLLLVGIGLGCVAAGYVLGGSRVHLALLGPMAFVVLTGVLTIRHEEKSFWGQMIMGVTFSGLGFPIAIAEGLSREIAMQSWIAWMFGFVAAVPALRSVFEKTDPHETRRRALVWLAALTVGGGIGLVLGVTLGFVPALPLVLVSWIVALWQPHPRFRWLIKLLYTAAAMGTAGVLIWLTRG
jgi:hypothetical protein